MLATQDRALESARRAHGWMTSHPDIIAANPSLERQVTLLDGAIGRISQAAAEQELYRVGGLERSTSLSTLRHELREQHMKPIVELAREIAPNAPEFAADVRLPAEDVRTERLLASAEAMAKAVEPKKDLFVEHGLPADFVEQLRAAADGVRNTVDARGSSRASRTGATETIRFDVRAARKAIRMIDTILRRNLRGSSELREWRSAKRITQRGQSASSSPQAPTVKEGTAA